MTSIGENAFSACTSLTSITIPNSVTTIRDYAFSSCSDLTSITIPNSVTSIGSGAFWGCSGLTSVTIPNSVTSIGSSAFEYCGGLTSVTIPNSVTTIGGSVFFGCSGLTSITIGNSVTTISDYAFSGCSGLTSVTIGSGVTRIYRSAFANCDDLTDVYCLAENVPSTSSEAFKDSYPQTMTLHVLAASIEAYKTTEPWKSFKNIEALEAGDIPTTSKCVTPTITYKDGKLSFSCETEGVEFVSDITIADAKKHYSNEITIGNQYTVTVYATKPGYEDSDKATLDFTASGIFGDLNGDGEVNVADHVKLSDIIMNK